MNDIEKAARLMGYKPLGTNIYGLFEVDKHPENNQPHFTSTFNPRTNKADLMDVEIKFDLEVMHTMCDLEGNYVSVYYYGQYGLKLAHVKFADHPTKFAARAEAVMSVVSQLYDAKYGKDGE